MNSEKETTTNFFQNDKPLYEIKTKAFDPIIAGYDAEKLAIYCIMFSHKFKDPDDRGHVAVVGPSSKGKSHTLNGVSEAYQLAGSDVLRQAEEIDEPKKREEKYQELYKQYDGICINAMSKETIKYFNYPYDNKIMVLTELDAAIMAAGHIRTMMSDGSKAVSYTVESTKDGRHYVRPLIINGKAVFAVTTASEELEHQFGNRVSLIYLDKSDDDAIHEMIDEMHGDREAFRKRYQGVHQLRDQTHQIPLIDYVKIPANIRKKISKIWPKDSPAQNRIHNDFNRLLKCIAAIHQHKEVNGDDYECTRRIFKCIQKHKLPAPLLKTLKTIQTELERQAQEKNTKDYLNDKGEITIGIDRDRIGELIGLGERTVSEHIAELQKAGILIHRANSYIRTDPVYGTKQRVNLPATYTLTSYGKTGIQLPQFHELMGEDYDPNQYNKPYDPLTGETLPIPPKNQNTNQNGVN